MLKMHFALSMFFINFGLEKITRTLKVQKIINAAKLLKNSIPAQSIDARKVSTLQKLLLLKFI